ncbi:MAG: acetyl-CoA carboxylase biotin carboxyl carrier protein, partial [candidate division WOR-3 bacterium]|nr:acetyl-CoA carboxylase biotin carboxyl carrier protein [candidate division WOR-3 bacterium]
VRDYVRGLYGRPPVPIKENIRKKILGSERPINERPADRLEPIMDKVRNELDKKFVKKEEDYISYALFPEVALRFFEYRENPTQVKFNNNVGEELMRDEDKQGLNVVKELIELLAKNNIGELEWEFGGNKIKIKRQTSSQPPIATEIKSTPTITQTPIREVTTINPDVVIAPKAKEEIKPIRTEEIKSPMVGTFYARPRPDAPPFVEKNDIVEAGTTLCIIEAMKLMNEIETEKKCRIVDILVTDGSPVEYGQPLFIIEPLS